MLINSTVFLTLSLLSFLTNIIVLGGAGEHAPHEVPETAARTGRCGGESGVCGGEPCQVEVESQGHLCSVHKRKGLRKEGVVTS